MSEQTNQGRKHCPFCGQELHAEASFCIACGQEQPPLAPLHPLTEQVQARPATVQPEAVPMQPTPATVQPVPVPVQPTPEPVQSFPAPVQPTPTPFPPPQAFSPLPGYPQTGNPPASPPQAVTRQRGIKGLLISLLVFTFGLLLVYFMADRVGGLLFPYWIRIIFIHIALGLGGGLALAFLRRQRWLAYALAGLLGGAVAGGLYVLTMLKISHTLPPFTYNLIFSLCFAIPMGLAYGLASRRWTLLLLMSVGGFLAYLPAGMLYLLGFGFPWKIIPFIGLAYGVAQWLDAQFRKVKLASKQA